MASAMDVWVCASGGISPILSGEVDVVCVLGVNVTLWLVYMAVRLVLCCVARLKLRRERGEAETST